MGIKDKSRTLAAGASVALATAGLSSCQDNGAVDPPPPPLECNAVDEGETLTATATLSGRELRVTIVHNGAFAYWASLELAAVVGGTARPAVLSGNSAAVVIDLADESVTGGSFAVRGTLRSRNSCIVSRVFSFTIGPGGVIVAAASPLPLSSRQQARIALLGRQGHEVELEATTPFRGARAVSWTVTGGEVVPREGDRARWRLPEAPGLYQAELVIDYGPAGLSVDTLVLEVFD